jgi:hypothetical protein
MRYGILIKDINRETVSVLRKGDILLSVYEGATAGTWFEFDVDVDVDVDEDWGKVISLETDIMGKQSTMIPKSFMVEITEEEYNRINAKEEPKPNIHPKLLKAYESGDFGCQSESVKGILEAITEMFKEAK